VDCIHGVRLGKGQVARLATATPALKIGQPPTHVPIAVCETADERGDWKLWIGVAAPHPECDHHKEQIKSKSHIQNPSSFCIGKLRKTLNGIIYVDS
jgi:hypothetical protein